MHWRIRSFVLRTQVYVHPALAVPYMRHRGSATSSFMLRAVPSFGQSKSEAFDFVAVK